MSEECPVNCELTLNNDIMGVGVRAALYSQIILAWLMCLKWPRTFIKNSRAAYMTATAVLVASLIQWRTQDLSILDALVVSLLTSMMTIFIVVSGTSREEVKQATGQPNHATSENVADPAQASAAPNDQPSATPTSPQPALIRNRNSQQTTPQSPATQPMNTQASNSPVTVPQVAHTAPSNVQPQAVQPQADAQASDSTGPTYKPQTSNTQWFIRFCFVNLWGGWCFNFWNDPAHFGLDGPRANCTTNSEVKIWVFGEEVQAVSHGIRIAALVLVSFLYFVAIFSLFFTLEDVLEPAVKTLRSIGDLFVKDPSTVVSRAITSRTLHEDPMINKVHYLLHLFACGTLVYLIISIERTVQTNDKKRETMEWSYGQVIALILLLQQLMDLCSTIIEIREESQVKKEREEREEQHKKRAQLLIDTRQQENISLNNLTPVTPSTVLTV